MEAGLPRDFVLPEIISHAKRAFEYGTVCILEVQCAYESAELWQLRQSS